MPNSPATLKFSFVVLTWNRVKFLEICLEKLMASIGNVGECEVVVMDNGSTDSTPSILSKYSNNPLVRVITLPRNYGLNAYKKLFRAVRSEYVVIVDDDVLDFPAGLDRIFLDAMTTFKDYGLIALNVVQNEFTNGAKPSATEYAVETRDGITIERGPTGGWCACFRRRDYQRLWPWTLVANLDMKRSEDGFLVDNFERRLKLHSGILRDYACFHAAGPYYAKMYGHLDREIEKYANSGLDAFVKTYEEYRKE